MEVNNQTECDLLEATPKHGDDKNKNIHHWRRCGIGQYFVREHKHHTPPSKEHPDGTTSTTRAYCADNPHHKDKDQLSFDEIQHITMTYFAVLSGPPTAGGALTKKFSNADQYNSEIRGWTQYWNDIFKLDHPLDPNVVKALIATESSFDLHPKKHPEVYGLMQIIGKTHQYLSGEKGELKDHFICISASELLDASCNICSGIRWLFRKIETASWLLQRSATWEETVEDYKAILELRIHNKPYNPQPMKDFRQYHKWLSDESHEKIF
ncbi:MAG: hypothetical protein ACD_46C00154G0003 [uncultured bacterium]|nr:MAG: hypothetical protein ACD_46C00154G0003 [uncultured bacterium]OGT49022.1 MAG: hypothetical protein A3E82_08770 [Gammaproteobacteria bacterium RIFCSPHIGHO2_12_FULL_38_11]